VPFFEPGLEELVGRNMKGERLSFTTDIESAVQKSLAIFIAVGTPQSADGAADLRFVKEVALSVARHMNGYKVVVTKSTVPMGTGAMIRRTIQEKQAHPTPFKRREQSRVPARGLRDRGLHATETASSSRRR